MADFKTHITASSLLGIGYGAAGHFMYDLPLPSCVLAGALCGVSGMLPDIDSGPGRPLRESLAFAAAVVPMMLVDRLEQLGLSQESIVLAGGAIYLLVRFGLGAFLHRYTVHRGMFHSVPAAIIFGELAFLLASGELDLRIYKAGGVVAGYLAHMLLDEFYSIEWYRGRLRFKKSFGTGLKLFSHSLWANLTTYAKLAALTYIVLHEPGWTQQIYQENVQQHIHQVADQARQHLTR